MSSTKVLAIGCDHAAFDVKTEVCSWLRKEHNDVEILDVGCYSTDRVDYPDYAQKVALNIASGKASMGILICGTGIGMSIAANKIKGIRAAVCHDYYTAELTRKHNDANVLCVGARNTGIEIIKQMITVFLRTKFEGRQHTPRLVKISKL